MIKLLLKYGRSYDESGHLDSAGSVPACSNLSNLFKNPFRPSPTNGNLITSYASAQLDSKLI